MSSLPLDKNICGRVFVELTEGDLKDYGFVSSGFYTRCSILREVRHNMPGLLVLKLAEIIKIL